VVQRTDFVSSLAKAELGPQPATLSPSFSAHSYNVSSSIDNNHCRGIRTASFMRTTNVLSFEEAFHANMYAVPHDCLLLDPLSMASKQHSF
jgi:hypothetical protein